MNKFVIMTQESAYIAPLHPSDMLKSGAFLEFDGYRVNPQEARFNGNLSNDQIVKYDNKENFCSVLIPVRNVVYIRKVSANKAE